MEQEHERSPDVPPPPPPPLPPPPIYNEAQMTPPPKYAPYSSSSAVSVSSFGVPSNISSISTPRTEENMDDESKKKAKVSDLVKKI